MEWLRRLTERAGRHAHILAVAETVAEDCFETVWQRVEDRVVGMSPAMARGYVRARAAIVIQRRLDVVLTERRRAWLNRARIYALAIDEIVQRSVTQAMVVRAAQGELRRAA